MDLNEAMRLLKIDLTHYRGDEGKHGKLKQQIARELLMTLLKFSFSEITNQQFINSVTLSYILSHSRHRLLQLKCKPKGKLDLIVEKYIFKLRNGIIAH